MRGLFTSLRFSLRDIGRALLSVALLAGFAGICQAQADDDNDADDGFYLLRFNVPPVPESFNKSRGSWGALVLTFNGPAAGTGLEGAMFQFLPQCPGWTPGKVDDLNSDFPNIQLGPGNYRLGATGSTISGGKFDGQMFGTFDVIVEYEKIPNQPPPMVTSAFWQNKLTLQQGPNKGQTTWTFDANPNDPDMMVTSIPTPMDLVPEPSSIGLCLFGAGGLLLAYRKRYWRRT